MVVFVSARGSCTTAGREGRIKIGASCPSANLVSGVLVVVIGGRRWLATTADVTPLGRIKAVKPPRRRSRFFRPSTTRRQT